MRIKKDLTRRKSETMIFDFQLILVSASASANASDSAWLALMSLYAQGNKTRKRNESVQWRQGAKLWLKGWVINCLFFSTRSVFFFNRDTHEHHMVLARNLAVRTPDSEQGADDAVFRSDWRDTVGKDKGS